jgi:Zn-dependent M16 (insulinase) family peptidase
MKMTTGMPNVTLRAGATRHGFQVQTVTPMPALRANVYECVHIASGARLVHLHTTDVENHLTIAVRTPPADDTGVAHILEHVVLCGSKKYPVKELFMELMKRSLATNLNGYTMADCTGYPLASCNRKDFFNLAEVYCDVVFQPLLYEHLFQQEGHHLAFSTPGDVQTPLEIKGIVYSEMKGDYSSLDGRIWRELRRVLLGGNAYGFDSGGDPAAIPTLTHAQFLAFHRAHYHPANACFLLSGDIATAEHLAFFARVCLDGTPRGQAAPAIAPQPRWTAPRQATIPYAIAADEEPARRTAVVLAFFTNPLTEHETAFALSVLSYYLVGNPSSPLYRALLESRLGDELTVSGYVAHQRDTFFMAGLKGTDAAQAGAIVALVRAVLAREVRDGFARDRIAAAFHQVELALREQVCTTPGRLLRYALLGWLYEQSPLQFMQFNEVIETVRQHWERTPRYFEELAARTLLNNPHHCVLTFVPDQACDARAQQALAAALAEKKRQMSAEDLATVARVALELEAQQTAPNSAAALATLPRLRLADVPVAPQKLPTKCVAAQGRTLLTTDVFTNGLTYVKLAFDVRGLAAPLVPYLNVYAQLLPLMGAGTEDYASLAAREAGVCSGLAGMCSAHGCMGAPDDTQCNVYFSGHALERNTAAMLELMRMRISAGTFRDRRRLRDVLLQQRTMWRDGLAQFSGYFAQLHAERIWSYGAWLNDQCQGLPLVRQYERLARAIDADPEALMAALEQIRDYCAQAAPVTACVAGSAAAQAHVQAWLAAFAHTPQAAPVLPAWTRPSLSNCAGIVVPTQVAANVTAMRLTNLPLADCPVMLLIRTALRHGYLWDEVRIRGNAYGVDAQFAAVDGIFTLDSSEDPHIARTYAVFQRVPEYIATQMDLSPAGVEQAIIDAVKTLDRPLRGSQSVSTALHRHVTQETPARRAAFRKRFLALTRADVLRVNETHIRPALAQATWCSFAGEAQLRKAAAELPLPLAIATPYAEA